MTYAEARLDEFNAMRASGMYGIIQIQANNLTANVICTAVNREKNMTPGPYMMERTSTFDMLRTDFVAMELAEEKTFISNQVTWQIRMVKDDAIEPTVQLIASKKK